MDQGHTGMKPPETERKARHQPKCKTPKRAQTKCLTRQENPKHQTNPKHQNANPNTKNQNTR